MGHAGLPQPPDPRPRPGEPFDPSAGQNGYTAISGGRCHKGREERRGLLFLSGVWVGGAVRVCEQVRQMLYAAEGPGEPPGLQPASPLEPHLEPSPSPHLYQAGGPEEDKIEATLDPQTSKPGQGRAPMASSAPRHLPGPHGPPPQATPGPWRVLEWGPCPRPRARHSWESDRWVEGGVQVTCASLHWASAQDPTGSPLAHLRALGSQSGSGLQVPDGHHGVEKPAALSLQLFLGPQPAAPPCSPLLHPLRLMETSSV